MTMIPPIVAVPSHVTESAIAITSSGQRFYDEAGPYLDRVKAREKQHQQSGFYIFDGKTFANKRFYVDPMPGKRISANTLEDLVAKIGVPADALQRSVQDWNSFLASGEEREKGTGRAQFAPDRRGITEAPFYASPMVAGISLTVGGFVITETIQVVNIFGEVVPGLFAVSDCAGGLTPTAERGGTHLGGGFVMGWVAGGAAATGKTSLPHTRPVFGQFIRKEEQISGPIINVAAEEVKGQP